MAIGAMADDDAVGRLRAAAVVHAEHEAGAEAGGLQQGGVDLSGGAGLGEAGDGVGVEAERRAGQGGGIERGERAGIGDAAGRADFGRLIGLFR